MRLTIVNLLISERMEGGTERSTSILARKPGKMNPPYAGRCTAADAEYKICDVKDARRRLSFVRVAAPPPRPSPANAGEGAARICCERCPPQNAVNSLSRSLRGRVGVGAGLLRRLFITPPFCDAVPAHRRSRLP